MVTVWAHVYGRDGKLLLICPPRDCCKLCGQRHSTEWHEYTPTSAAD